MMATKEITKESIVDKFYAYAQRNVELMMDGQTAEMAAESILDSYSTEYLTEEEGNFLSENWSDIFSMAVDRLKEYYFA